MLNFRLGNLTVGVSYEALQKHAHIEKFGSGRSVVGLKKNKISFSVEKCFFEAWESFSQCSKFPLKNTLNKNVLTN